MPDQHFMSTGALAERNPLSAQDRGPGDWTRLFAAVHALWQAQPWEYVDQLRVLQLDVPALGVEAACLSISGAGGGARGFTIYPSLHEFARMVERATRVGRGELQPDHTELTLELVGAEETSERIGNALRDRGWVSMEPEQFPLLQRYERGVEEPVTREHLRLATLVATALSQSARCGGQLLREYGSKYVREYYYDVDGTKITLRAPHPGREPLDFSDPPRAQTLAGVPNPYRLPLSPEELALFESALDNVGMHGLMGVLCALGSVPRPPDPSIWSAAMADRLLVSTEAERKTVTGMVKRVSKAVTARMREGDFDSLVPVCSNVEACRDWAAGYGSLCDGLSQAEDRTALQCLLAVQLVAADPVALMIVGRERGAAGRARRVVECIDELGDRVDYLYHHWEERRSAGRHLPAVAEPVRVEAKAGRNDACLCGSGKKFKKCCA